MVHPSEGKMRSKKAIIFFSVIGGVLAALSQYQHELFVRGMQSGSSFCNVNEIFNCDKVIQSAYSTLFGLSLAGIGLVYYVSILIGAIVFPVEIFISLTFASALFASALSAFLFYVSNIKIGAFCLLCMGMYAVNFLLLIVSLFADENSFGIKFTKGIKEFFSYFLSLFQPSGKNFWKNWIIAAVAGISFWLVFTWPSMTLRSASPQQNNSLTQQQSRVINFIVDEVGSPITRDYVLGPQSALFTIIEFSDFECPACRQAFPVIESLLHTHKDKVRFVPKNYPLDKSCNERMQVDGHKHACFTAQLVRCAGEEDKFWEAYRFAFTAEAFSTGLSPEGVERSLWSGIGSLGLDVDALQECVQSKRQLQKIKSDITEGNNAGIQGTPSFYVNGKFLSLEQVKHLLNSKP